MIEKKLKALLLRKHVFIKITKLIGFFQLNI